MSVYKDASSGKQFADINFKGKGRLNLYTNGIKRFSIDENGYIAQGTDINTTVFYNMLAGNKTGMYITNATTATSNPTLYLLNNSAGATDKYSLIVEARNSSGVGSSGLAGVVKFMIENGSGTEIEDMAHIRTTLTNFTSGSCNGQMKFSIDSTSALKDRLILDNNGITTYGTKTEAKKLTGNIVAGTGITGTMLWAFIEYNGNSAIDISANPQIAAGTLYAKITLTPNK